MKMKMISKPSHLLWMMLALITLCFGSCKDDDREENNFDPTKPLILTDFSPKEGGVGTRMLIEGDNFGSDASKIKVIIGGVEAPVISSNGTDIYCMVPNKAFEGTLEIKIVDGQDDEIATTVANEKFTYIKKMLVTTLLGTMDEKNNYEHMDGPFEKCGGIARASWLSFDPKNPNHLYLIGDQGAPFRLIDFERKYVSTQFNNGAYGMDRMRSIAWTVDGDRMIIATDRGGDSDQSNSFLKRSDSFMSAEALTRSRQCNGSDIHPVNGELYYNSYGMGKVFRYDLETNETDELFSIQDSNWEFTIQIHPTGNYAYIVVINKHYILRTDYDWDKKRFTTPYIVCGWPGSADWVDGVGTRARLSSPYQGAFVKNPEYEGTTEEYDFYFCEAGNQCVSTLTPNGKVTTFAGRGSLGVNTDAHGYIDGDLRKEARFNQPEGLVYDEANKTFYVGDRQNHRIRKIAYEEE